MAAIPTTPDIEGWVGSGITGSTPGTEILVPRNDHEARNDHEDAFCLAMMQRHSEELKNNDPLAHAAASYGDSVLRRNFRNFRLLRMMEDAAAQYRLTRAPTIERILTRTEDGLALVEHLEPPPELESMDLVQSMSQQITQEIIRSLTIPADMIDPAAGESQTMTQLAQLTQGHAGYVYAPYVPFYSAPAIDPSQFIDPFYSAPTIDPSQFAGQWQVQFTFDHKTGKQKIRLTRPLWMTRRKLWVEEENNMSISDWTFVGHYPDWGNDHIPIPVGSIYEHKIGTRVLVWLDIIKNKGRLAVIGEIVDMDEILKRDYVTIPRDIAIEAMHTDDICEKLINFLDEKFCVDKDGVSTQEPCDTSSLGRPNGRILRP